MIKEITLKDIEIGQESNKDIIKKNVSGKILKIQVVVGEVNAGMNLKILTREGETVLNVSGSGVYYPRSNISSQKLMEGSINMEGDKMDYYYFYNGLLFNITKSNPKFEGVIIERVTILYDDCSR